jgi:oligoendopeptidase F
MTELKPFVRKFLPKDLKINLWEDAKPYADDLLQREWSSLSEFEEWLYDWSELQVVVGEEFIWRMIRPTLDTANEEFEKSYNDFLNLVSAELSKFENAMNKRVLESQYSKEFKQPGFEMLLKRLQASNEIYREENISLGIEDSSKNIKSGQIKGAMTVELDGEKMTLQQAGIRLEWADRAKREEAWRVSSDRRYQDKDALDENLSELIPIRNQIAKNAGFDNYRDYVFRELQRFDYTPEDCFVFHDAIEKEVLPLVKISQEHRAKQMGLEKMMPWDGGCDPLGRPALKAFDTSVELVDKSLAALKNIDEVFFYTLNKMKEMDYLDLDSRMNKAPGGYNAELPESQTSFMFYNVVGRSSDVETIMHETGHAAHNTLTRHLPLNAYRQYPMEVGELASMSMELLAHDEWYRFFPKEEDQNRVKYEHLRQIVGFFPHMAKIDAFQHEIYLKPEMTAEQRHDFYDGLQKRFDTGMVDWKGFEHQRRTAWQSQGHIFEVPFYYIEYGIAQLGALQVWRNYKQDKKQALEMYKNALALGYTKPIPEIYETAGIKFDFSATMLKELMAFVQKEMQALV